MALLSYTELLDRASTKTRQLKAEYEQMNLDYTEIAILGNRLDIHNLNDFHSRKQAFFAEIRLKEKEIRRSQIREAECRRKIALGMAREILELVGA